MSKLPKFTITIDEDYSENGEDLGIEMIANTARPAIKVKGFAFTNQAPEVLSFADSLKYRIAGPIMIPGDIYRCDEDGFEYEVSFTSEEIEKIHSKFMLTNKSKDIFNVEHNSQNVLPSFILEAILVDSQSKITMIKEEYNIDVPMGTSFVVQQFTDKEVYNQMVEEGRIGFSIEGFLGMKLSEQINNNKEKQKETKMEDFKLPAGEYLDKDGNVFVVAEDGTITKQDKVAEDVEMAEASVVEDKQEEVEMAEPVAPVAEPASEPVVAVETYTKEEVDAKFNEIYQMIADMKAEETIEDETPESMEPVTLSAHERFAAFARFTSK